MAVSFMLACQISIAASSTAWFFETKHPFYSMRSKMVEAFHWHYLKLGRFITLSLRHSTALTVTSLIPDIASPAIEPVRLNDFPRFNGAVHVNKRTFDIFPIYRRMFVGSRTWSYDLVEGNSTSRRDAQSRLLDI